MSSPYNESYSKHCKESRHHVKFSKIWENTISAIYCLGIWCLTFSKLNVLFASTYTKIGTIQRRLAWPLRKDDKQNREAFHIFWLHYLYLSIDAIWFEVHFSKFWEKWAQTWSFQVLSEASTHAGSNQVPIHICLVLNLSVDLIIVRYVLTLQWIIF